MDFFILGTSIVLQLAAAGIALSFVRITGFMAAWVLVALALTLMALRRSITFYYLFVGDSPQPANMTAELTALLISALMLVGIFLIRPYFVSHNRTNDRLRESRARYRDILENMSDTFFRTDAAGRLTIVSSSAAQLLGYAPNELIGTFLRDLYVDSEEHDLYLIKLGDKGRVQDHQAWIAQKDGAHVLIESNSHLVTDADGKVVGVEGLARNVTARKQAEQLNTRLGRIVEDSVNEIYVFDSESLTFSLVNRGARENLGYTNEEMKKLTPVDLKPDFSEQELRRLIEPLRNGSTRMMQFETVHRRKDGSTYAVDVRLQLARSETPPVFFAVIQDISERKRVEEELVQSQKLRAVGQLTGGIAHDFNNLLTVILGNLELARAAPDMPESMFEFLDASTVAAEKSASLTQRLLAFSRRQPLEPEVVDPEELITGMYELIRRSLREDIDIEIDCAGGTWRCEADVGQLENALLNLAINANDAMSGGGRLTLETSNVVLDDEFVSLHPDATAGQYVLLSVSDTGRGMTPEMLGLAFEPFFTTKRNGEGTGLGLSMVYGFVRQSGGVVYIDSEADVGTTVRVYLPIASGCADPARPMSRENVPPPGAGERVLVVEDDKDLLMLTGRLLDQLGYDVIHALDANRAMEILEESSDIDLLLTDIILRGSIDGAKFAEEAQRKWPGLKVLYMSGYIETNLNDEGRLRPDISLLRKPFAKSQLAEKVSAKIAEC